MTSQPAVSLSVAIEKRLGAFELRPRFAVGRELLVLFGHSGSGKSLTLQAVAGLLRPDAGRIEIDGVPLVDAALRVDTPPQQRDIGMVVQDYALFPHMSVAENIAFGIAGWPAAERRARVRELTALLGLEGLEERRPHQVSGGQAQRVALARALARRPRLLLLDEPFSALDSAIRVGLRRELTRLKRELDLTIVFVTHDLREAYNLADKVAVFDRGRVLQLGPRDDVFDHPASARVAELTEVRNIWRGTVSRVEDEHVWVDTGRFVVRGARPGAVVGKAVDVCIRPERVILQRRDRPRSEAPDGTTLLQAAIVDEIAHGSSFTLLFAVEGAPRPTTGHDIEVDLPVLPYEVLGVRGERHWLLSLPPSAVHLMPAL